jgi:hypothetical protein
MFYKKGIDITNDKQMFNFLKSHFTYFVANPWNHRISIANNVKLYNLNLSGYWQNALNILEDDDYFEIRALIQDWLREHSDCCVYFNGRSAGYLVLCDKYCNDSILPDYITDSDTYEDYKQYCKDSYDSVRANRQSLVYYTKLVQDFDKLCDSLRDYCDIISKADYAAIKMQRIVHDFNYTYEKDLEFLGFCDLECSEDGIVNISEILNLHCLYEAFLKLTKGELEFLDDKGNVKLISLN